MTDRMSPSGLALAIFTAFCSAIGIAAMKAGLATTPLHLAPFLAGLATYVVGLVTGVILVAVYPLSLAYPIVVGLSLVLLGGLSALWLGETLTPTRLAGTVLVILGVALLAAPARTERGGAGSPPLE
jgi:multidrug transporter EmrE-like cation transporter